MSMFLVESNNNGDYDFSNSTTKVWSLEDILREINRDTTCTDPNGDVMLEDGSDAMVMAGSHLDTNKHEECWKPYNEGDWEEGWNEWCTHYHRVIEVIEEKENGDE